MRVRSTTRARRLLVPSARTEEALVLTAGATTAVRTAKGLPATRLYCTARPFFPVVDSANLACGGLASSRISCLRRLGRPRDSGKGPGGGGEGQGRSRMTDWESVV